MRSIETLPLTEKNYKGVIILREQTIPVFDLSLSLGMEESEYNDRSVIIILEMDDRDASPYIGIKVDAVSEVRQINASEIEKPEQAGSTDIQEYIIGMAKIEDNIETLLDIELLLKQKAEKQVLNVA